MTQGMNQGNVRCECGGRLVLITETPIKAGHDKGAVYYLYSCSNKECGKMKLVGGK